MQVLGPFEIVPGVGPKRHVRVYVPRRARPADRPLLLLFDGQNVFHDAPSFAGGWHAHQEVERLAKSVSPPVIVGVDHGHEHRISELSPFDFGKVKGSLEPLLEWLVSWLLPQLRAAHRLSADRRKVVIGGSSLGGLAALYAALRHPGVFGGALAMSPSVWVAGGAFLHWAPARARAADTRIYLDAGAREGGGRMLAMAERAASVLSASGVADLKFRADARGQHREADWRRRLLPALRYHFGKSR